MRHHLDPIVSRPETSRPVVLEGCWLGQRSGRALAAADPVSVLEGDRETLEPFADWLAWHAQRHPRGAAIGYVSYEMATAFERVALPKAPGVPCLSFAYYPELERVPVTTGDLARTAGRAAGQVEAPPSRFRTNFDEARYGKAIARIREYLAAGDIYQANLTQQFSVGTGDLSAAEIYERLAIGPARFRALLKTPGLAIVSNSPERFFHVSHGRVLSSPIKGTIARDEAASDVSQAATLAGSAKDRAENVMIVDLIRNDLGRICECGSIQAKLCEVLPLPHLFHLVSHVEGTLRPGTGFTEILRALFPCGSITGAPKIRAMEILAEIEQKPRGVSMGAIGIILGHPLSRQFEMDFSVAIRTLTLQNRVATFNVGGGIVYDSQAAAEWAEMLVKARPLLDALGVREPSDPARSPFSPHEITLRSRCGHPDLS